MGESAISVKNVIFDMGNVLMTFDGPSFSARFTDTPEDAALLQDALFGSSTWALLDSGTITHETMLRVAAAHLPERLHPNLRACMARWPDYSEPIEAVNDLAIRLKGEGYGIYVLTNASTRVMDQLGHAPVIPYLDGYVVSGIERLMKPETTARALASRACTRTASRVTQTSSRQTCDFWARPRQSRTPRPTPQTGRE